jgi:hypothetical protein
LNKLIFVPTRTGTEWQRLLAKPEVHWREGQSAMAAAAAWEAARGRLPAELGEALEHSADPDLTDLKLLAAFPEWEATLEAGERPSRANILALARNDRGLVAIGVEAVVDEGFSLTLAQKRASIPDSGREKLLALESALKPPAAFDGAISYQLVHRAASTLREAQAFHAHVAVMAVQAFGAAQPARGHFDAFASALGAARISDEVSLAAQHGSPRLLLAWCAGNSRFLKVDLGFAL